MDLAIEMIARSLVLFAIAGAALLWLRVRRASAAARHLICSLTLAALLILPAASFVLPARNVAVLPPPRLASEADMALLKERTPAEMHLTSTNVPATELMERPVRSSNSGLGGSPISWPTVAFYAYLAGVVFLLARMVAGRITLLRYERDCREVAAGESLREAQEATARELGVCRPVRLLAGSSAAVPATWSILRPILLLPEDARHWSPERLRAVLLHEMAHIRRADGLTSAIAEATCTLWWFNPLVWWTAARMRYEAERACDDQVVVAGVPAIEYAAYLLEAGRAASAIRYALPVGAIAMATRRPSLRTRFDAVLDRTSDRRAVRPGFAIGALVVTSGLLVTVATLRPAARAEQLPASSYLQRFPNGVTVELIGVADALAPAGSWWTPDGTGRLAPTQEPPRPAQLEALRYGPSRRVRVAALRVRYPHDVLVNGEKPTENSSVDYRLWSSNSRGDDAVKDNTLRYVVFSGVTDKGEPVDQTEMLYHVSTGRWETMATWPAQANAEVLQTKYGKIDINWDPAHGNVLRVDAPVSNLVMRVRRKASDGAYYPGDGTKEIPLYKQFLGGNSRVLFTLAFPKKQRGEAFPDAFELQVRPSYTADFATVALQAGGDAAQRAAERAKAAEQQSHRDALEERRQRLREVERDRAVLSAQQAEASVEGKVAKQRRDVIDAQLRALAAERAKLSELRDKDQFVRAVEKYNQERRMQREGDGEQIRRQLQQLQAQRAEINAQRAANEARARMLDARIQLLNKALQRKAKAQ